MKTFNQRLDDLVKAVAAAFNSISDEGAPQTLTDEEKATARSNIGALGGQDLAQAAEEISTVQGQIATLQSQISTLSSGGTVASSGPSSSSPGVNEFADEDLASSFAESLTNSTIKAAVQAAVTPEAAGV